MQRCDPAAVASLSHSSNGVGAHGHLPREHRVIGSPAGLAARDDPRMTRLLVVLLLGTASIAGASPLASLDGAPGSVAPPGATPPRARAPSPPVASESESIWLVQTALGTVAGAAGGWAGVYLGYQLSCSGRHCQDFDGLDSAILGGVIGLTATTTAAVVFLGRDRDHESSIALTWLGAFVGCALGLAGASQVGGESWVAPTLVVAASTALGGTLMHQWTRSRNLPATAWQLVPFSDATTAIGLSLGGTF